MIIGMGGIGGKLLAFASLLVLLPDKWANRSLGSQLKTTLERAIKGSETQRKEADSMTLAWSKYVPDWRRMLNAYKQDQSNPNPFEEPNPGKLVHVCACVLELTGLIDDALDGLGAQLSREDLGRSISRASFRHESSHSEFLQQALTLEAAQ
jgi:hypothetical protein